MKPVLVLKIGTNAITTPEGLVDEKIIENVASQVVKLDKTYNIAIVSSGAVGAGQSLIHNFSGKLLERKAAAAIGSPILIANYAKAFQPLGLSVAQALCERRHFSDREQFLQLRETFETLWKHNCIPVVNENDVVSDLELRFTDNDELATLLAVGFGAQKLLLATTVDGLLDGETLVREITCFDENIFGLAHKKKSDFGLGGMISKLSCAHLAVRMGTDVVIFKLGETDGILKAERSEIGTLCKGADCARSARQRWMGSGSLSVGKVIVDSGAAMALENRKSLLAVGVKSVEGAFEKGEMFDICTEEGVLIAVARAKINSENLISQCGQKGVEVAHADEIVVV